MAHRLAQTHLRNSNMLMLKLAGCGSNPNSARSSTGNLSRPHPKLDRKNAPTSIVSEKTCHSKSLPNGIPKRHEAMTFNELIVFQPFRMSFLPAKVNAAKLNAASGVPHSSKTSRGVSHFAATLKSPENHSSFEFLQLCTQLCVQDGPSNHPAGTEMASRVTG